MASLRYAYLCMRMRGRMACFAEGQEEERLIRQLVEISQTLETLGSTTRGANYEAQCIYKGRNILYRITVPEGVFVVKSFAIPSLMRRIYYSYLGSSKAARSHRHALELARRHIDAPPTVGYAEERGLLGLIRESYYISREIEHPVLHLQAHSRGWASPTGFSKALATYLAQVHRAGVEHLDLSPGNILYSHNPKTGYQFAMVDLNRMRFHKSALDTQQSIYNMRSLMSIVSPCDRLAEDYAEARGWNKHHVREALTREVDAFWHSRLLKLSRRYSHGQHGVSALRFYMAYLRYRIYICTGHKAQAERIYRNYLQREDIRHVERHKRGFTYQYLDKV